MLSAYALAALAGYLLGSFPTGYLVGRSRGMDIRQHGSGNIGATNVMRVLGKGPGYLVFFCDALKGWLSVTVAQAIFHFFLKSRLSPDSSLDADLRSTLVLVGIVGGVACILGHNFPVWLRFRGGKGIATSAGVLLGLMPIAVAVGAVVWATAFFTMRYVSVASLLAAIALPITVAFLWRTGRADGALFTFSLLAAALAFWRHRTNLARLRAGTEPRSVKK